MTYTYTLTDQADEAVRKRIVEPLVQYNAHASGAPAGHRPLVVALRDASGGIVGGLWGVTGYEWLFTQLLVVPEAARGGGVGTHLMRLAEQEAVARGCHHAWLDTFSFQARPFYERLGYACFAELPDYPTGFSRYFMKKALSAA